MNTSNVLLLLVILSLCINIVVAVFIVYNYILSNIAQTKFNNSCLNVPIVAATAPAGTGTGTGTSKGTGTGTAK
jgi:hypothetical protein